MEHRNTDSHNSRCERWGCEMGGFGKNETLYESLIHRIQDYERGKLPLRQFLEADPAVKNVDKELARISLDAAIVQAVREGKDCWNGHESSPMALCLDGGHQGPEQYYWFCPLCLAGERLDTKNMSVDANNEHPMRKGTGL